MLGHKSVLQIGGSIQLCQRAVRFWSPASPAGCGSLAPNPTSVLTSKNGTARSTLRIAQTGALLVKRCSKTRSIDVVTVHFFGGDFIAGAANGSLHGKMYTINMLRAVKCVEVRVLRLCTVESAG